MNKHILLLLAAVSIFMSGCSLAPKFSQPQAPTPRQWPQGDAYKNNGNNPAVDTMTRQQFFGDKNLLQIIDMALANNRDLRLAILNVERVKGLYGVQRAELFPAVDLAAGGDRERLPADLSPTRKSMIQSSYAVNAGVAAWELDLFGRIRSLKDRALQEYLATEEIRRGVQISLVANIATTYFKLAADKQNLQLAQNILNTRQQSYTLVSKLLDAGLGTELDLQQARIPVATAQAAVANYQQQVAKDLNALNLLAGTTVPATLLPENLAAVAAPESINAGLPSDLLLNRPDIKAAEHRLKGANAYIGAARAAFFPRIALTASGGSASSELDGLFDAGSGAWKFAPQIVMPIFDARVWAAYRVSKAERKIALTQYEKSVQTAFKEVADALAVQGTIDRQIAAQRRLLAATKKACTLSQQRYTEGLDSYLGVLAAQQAQFAAEQGLISLNLAKRANQAHLYAVLGGGTN